MLGHIIVISPATAEIRAIARWTLNWIKASNIDIAKTVYTCQSISLAEDSLSVPIHLAQPPSLVVLDHAIGEDVCNQFANKLRACYPESWVVELADTHSKIAQEENAFQILKPVKKKDWEDLLAFIYLKAATPVWAKTLSS